MCVDVGPDRDVRAAARGWAMNGPEIIGLLAAVGLLAYLAIALLKPEWFA